VGGDAKVDANVPTDSIKNENTEECIIYSPNCI